MSTFKVGDRVRMLDTEDRELDAPPVGAIGTVVDATPAVTQVAWDDYTYRGETLIEANHYAVWNRELELIP